MHPIPASDRETMSRYYQLHAQIYDATRWMFLFGRDAIIDDLEVQTGETVLEIGCGTGRNFDRILRRVGASGQLIGVDCSAPMLGKCEARIEKCGWRNVRLVDTEYGGSPVARGGVDVVLMSYSLSMIQGWRDALLCARADLKDGGRIGVVDFCLESDALHARLFSRWLGVNHVEANRPYAKALRQMFTPRMLSSRSALAGVWRYFKFVGIR